MGNRKTSRGAMLLALAFVALMVIESQIKMRMPGETFKVISISLKVLYILSVILFVRSRIKADRSRRLKVREAELYADTMSSYHGSASGAAASGQSSYYIPEAGQSEDIVRQYSDEITRSRNDRNESVAGTLKKRGKALGSSLVRTALIGLVCYFVMFLLFHNSGDINIGRSMSDTFMMMKNSLRSSPGNDGTSWLPLLVIFVVFVMWRKNKKHDIKDDSVVFTKMIPQAVEKCISPDSTYHHEQGFEQDQMKRLNCFGYEAVSVQGRDMITGTYRNVPFRCAFENIMYEYWDDDGDGGRTKRIGTLFRGFVAEVPYRKKSGSMLGLKANSGIQMKNNLIDREENNKRTGTGINDTENEQFNMLFDITSGDEENLFYILTPDVMEKLVVLYSKYNNMLHLAFEGNKLYMCISAGDSYLRFKEESPTAETVSKIVNKINVDISKVIEILDAAMTIQNT